MESAPRFLKLREAALKLGCIWGNQGTWQSNLSLSSWSVWGGLWAQNHVPMFLNGECVLVMRGKVWLNIGYFSYCNWSVLNNSGLVFQIESRCFSALFMQWLWNDRELKALKDTGNGTVIGKCFNLNVLSVCIPQKICLVVSYFYFVGSLVVIYDCIR